MTTFRGFQPPSGWSLTMFEDIKAPGRHTLIGGPFGSELTRRDYVSEPGVPVIRGVNLGGDEGRFVDEDFVFVSEEKARQLAQNMAFPGDLVFTQRGTLGQVAVIPINSRFRRYIVSQSQMKLTLDERKALPRFVYHYFRSPFAATLLQQRELATGVPHINLSILREFPLLLPPLSEQQHIANILDKADAVRRKRQEAIGLTEEFLRSAFLEMFGDPVATPGQWEVAPLARLLTFITSGSRGWATYYVTEGSLFLRIQNVGHNRLMLGDIAYVKAPDTAEARRTTVQPGDVLLSITADLGRTAVVPTDLGVAYINQHLALLRVKGINPYYLSAFLASEGGKKQIDRLNRQGVKAGLNFDDVRSLRIPIPPLTYQEAYARLYQKALLTEARFTKARWESEELFRSLEQRAFRGEL